jgi:hypothetical protein
VVPRMARSAQGQVDGDTASDQHDGQARDQPPADRIAAIGITSAVDNVEGRPVRHKLKVSAATGRPAARTSRELIRWTRFLPNLGAITCTTTA